MRRVDLFFKSKKHGEGEWARDNDYSWLLTTGSGLGLFVLESLSRLFNCVAGGCFQCQLS